MINKRERMNKLVRLLNKQFEEENKEFYSPRDYNIARRMYVCYMLGTYIPKRVEKEDV